MLVMIESTEVRNGDRGPIVNRHIFRLDIVHFGCEGIGSEEARRVGVHGENAQQESFKPVDRGRGNEVLTTREECH